MGIRTWSKPRLAMKGKSVARIVLPQSPSLGASSRLPRLIPFLKYLAAAGATPGTKGSGDVPTAPPVPVLLPPTEVLPPTRAEPPVAVPPVELPPTALPPVALPPTALPPPIAALPPRGAPPVALTIPPVALPPLVALPCGFVAPPLAGVPGVPPCAGFDVVAVCPPKGDEPPIPGAPPACSEPAARPLFPEHANAARAMLAKIVDRNVGGCFGASIDWPRLRVLAR